MTTASRATNLRLNFSLIPQSDPRLVALPAPRPGESTRPARSNWLLLSLVGLALAPLVGCQGLGPAPRQALDRAASSLEQLGAAQDRGLDIVLDELARALRGWALDQADAELAASAKGEPAALPLAAGKAAVQRLAERLGKGRARVEALRAKLRATEGRDRALMLLREVSGVLAALERRREAEDALADAAAQAAEAATRAAAKAGGKP